MFELLPFYFLGFLGIGLTGGSVEDRRPHFWLKLAGAAVLPIALLLLIPGLAAVGAAKVTTLEPFGWLVLFLCIPLVMLSPAFLYERPDPRGGGGWGGGRGPDDPTPPPDGPGGGGLPLPMQDAVQARVRLREHGRAWRSDRPRRPAREPVRTPERV